MKLTDKAERIPHSRNADWRSDLCTQKRETQLHYHTGEIHSQPCSRGKEGRETAWYKDACVVESIMHVNLGGRLIHPLC